MSICNPVAPNIYLGMYKQTGRQTDQTASQPDNFMHVSSPCTCVYLQISDNLGLYAKKKAKSAPNIASNLVRELYSANRANRELYTKLFPNIAIRGAVFDASCIWYYNVYLSIL